MPIRLTKHHVRVSGDKLGLQFPIRKVARALIKGKYAENINIQVPIYMTAVLEYLATEVLELAGNAAKDANKDIICSSHIELPVANDEELHKLFGHLTIRGDGGGGGSDKTAIVRPVVIPPPDQTSAPPLFMDED